VNKRSRKHHYLPRHYLRGFVNSGGEFFVYDKQNDAIFHTAPDAAFFENDLNTVTFPTGTKSDFLEDMYSGLEQQLWSSFDAIRNSDPNIPVDLQDKMELFFFLSFLHWRLPCNAGRAEKLSQGFFGPDKGLSYFKIMNEAGRSAPHSIIERIRSSAAWKTAAKVAIPFAPFFAGDTWAADLDNWRFLYSGDDKNWYIVGDNPLITRGEHDHDPVTCLKEFIFPVSGRILAISVAGGISEAPPRAFTIEYGAAIIERSARFVACHDRAFLTTLVEYHKNVYVRFRKTHVIINDLFEMLREGQPQ
jgi:hypothetical protein